MSNMAQDLLQSEGWERFQRALGRRTHRVDGVLAIEMSLPFGGTYLYSPRASPPCHPEAKPKDLTSSVERVTRGTHAIFWRAEFDRQVSGVSPPRSEHRGCQVSEPRVLRRALEPEWTWRTSLEGSDDDRMAAMHEKHRYNVRLAERRGVTVRVSAPPPTPPQQEGESQPRSPTSYRGGVRGGAMPEGLETFWSLLQDTARRQGIATHPRSYYETMLRELSRKPTAASRKPDTDCVLYIVEHDDAPLAAAIVAYHGDTAMYLHGGSSYEHRALMAPHLLHWEAMRDAKAAGMWWYDWGGIQSPISNFKFQISNSDWSGMTRFKQGFGGEAVHHPPMRDLVFRPGWYRALSFLARLRN